MVSILVSIIQVTCGKIDKKNPTTGVVGYVFKIVEKRELFHQDNPRLILK
jgi:hypothetical protein